MAAAPDSAPDAVPSPSDRPRIAPGHRWWFAQRARHPGETPW